MSAAIHVMLTAMAVLTGILIGQHMERARWNRLLNGNRWIRMARQSIHSSPRERGRWVP